MAILALLLIPLLASAITICMRNPRRMEFVYLLSAAGSFLAAVWLAAEVLRKGTVSWGDGFLYADHLSALVAVLTAFVYLVSAPYAVGYFRQDQEQEAFGETGPGPISRAKLRKYYALTPLFGFSMFLVVVSNNLGVMWVAVEGTTLASIFLVTFYGRPTSLEAAWKYAVLGGVGLSMALFGTVLTYYAAQQVVGGESLGMLNWSVLVSSAAQFDKTGNAALVHSGPAGLWHQGRLGAHAHLEAGRLQRGSGSGGALMATAVLNCAIYALARFYVLTTRALGPSFASQLLILFGLLSIGIAVPFILVQRSYRRLLAYSSIDHGGIMVLGLGFGGALGALGMLLHMTFHSVTKPLLFFCAGNAQQHTGTDSLKKARAACCTRCP